MQAPHIQTTRMKEMKKPENTASNNRRNFSIGSKQSEN